MLWFGMSVNSWPHCTFLPTSVHLCTGTHVAPRHFYRRVKWSNRRPYSSNFYFPDTFDYESVLGTKPKVWVQLTRTTRVKKILVNQKKRAAKDKDEEDSVANDNPTGVEDGGDMVEVSAPTGKVPKKTAPKKTTSRVDEGEGADASDRGEESSDRSVLSENAGKRIKPTLPLTTCYTNTHPEYAKYFVSLGAGKQRELCVLSKCLEYRNMIASQVPIKSFPKWIPRQFLQVSSQVLFTKNSDCDQRCSARGSNFSRRAKCSAPADVWSYPPKHVL